jgi:hypothetical protein
MRRAAGWAAGGWVARPRVASAAVPDALFVPDGDRLVPTELTRGPWSADALHGGPVAALLARAVESCETLVPMRVARMTVDLLRPVPLTPLRVSARVVRPGRRVQLVEATVDAGDTPVARVAALRIRTATVPVPDQAPWPATPTDPLAVPERAFAPEAAVQGTAFHNAAVEMRPAGGVLGSPGPARVWMRLRHPVVAGEVATPLQQVAAIADFGNGISGIVPFETHTFVNPDLTVALFRLPVSGWIGLDAISRLGHDGTGLAESLLFDEEGPIGRAMQSLYVEAR